MTGLEAVFISGAVAGGVLVYGAIRFLSARWPGSFGGARSRRKPRALEPLDDSYRRLASQIKGRIP